MSEGLNTPLDTQSGTGSTTLSDTVTTEFDQTASDSGDSQKSYAQSWLESNDKTLMPSPPKKSAGGKPFECPYCFYVITVRNRRSWIQHLFTDLMPYVWVFPDCPAPAKLYVSRPAWHYHLQTIHCEQYESEAEFNCPLCHEDLTNNVRIDKHLGCHLEELDLFALPRTEDRTDN